MYIQISYTNMYVDISVYTYIDYVYIHTDINIYIYTYIYMYTYICIYIIYIYAHIYIYIYDYAYVYVHSYTHKWWDMRSHVSDKSQCSSTWSLGNNGICTTGQPDTMHLMATLPLEAAKAAQSWSTIARSSCKQLVDLLGIALQTDAADLRQLSHVL